MGLFKKNKKRDVIDLTDKLMRKQEQIAQMKQELQDNNQESFSQEGFSFLGNLAESIKNQNQEEQSNSYLDFGETGEKKKKFAKRIMDMTEKIEDLSNQVYHLQQRIEVLEQKMRVGNFDK